MRHRHSGQAEFGVSGSRGWYEFITGKKTDLFVWGGFPRKFEFLLPPGRQVTLNSSSVCAIMAPKRRLSGTRGPNKKRLKGEERHELRSVVRCLTKAGICVDDIVDDVFSPKQKDRHATRKFVNRWSTEEKLSRQNVHDLPRSGRPCSLTPAQKELIPKLLKKIETRNCELISRKWGVSEKERLEQLFQRGDL